MLLKASWPIASVAQFALIGLIAAHPVAAGDSVISAIGVVESTNCDKQTIKILGVTFAANDAGNAAAICGAEGLAGLRYVSVAGITASNGSILLTRLTTLSSGGYVPGATPVYLSGSITEARVDLGEAVVSGAVVSFGTVDLRFGSVIEILGTQPVFGGVILPTEVRLVDAVQFAGSELLADNSIGSDTSINSSVGSGISTNNSIGSVVSANSSIGSGTSTKSSIGSGRSANSSIGSGITARSSIGSGTSASSSIRLGVSANSSIGSGTSTRSSIGSGLSVSSSIGSGVSIYGSIGSDAQ